MSIRRTIVTVAVTSALLVVGAVPAGATAEARDNRLAGPDRYTTAQAVATATFRTATFALLASGRSFPDALAATYVSGASGVPLLLTEPASLPPGTLETLEQLEVDGVLIVGGSAAVSGDVAVQLEQAGYTTSRVAGTNRYETARQIAEIFSPEAIGVFNGGRAAIIATGERFPDALAAGPMSSSQGVPILLTPQGALHAEARAALRELGIEQALIVGGTAAVSDQVAAEIAAMGIEVQRVAGPNRQATARQMAQLTKAGLGYSIDRVILARGDDFADALAGGTRGGWLQAPLLLVASADRLGDEAGSFIAANDDTIVTIDILGGTSAISQAVAAEAVRAAGGG